LSEQVRVRVPGKINLALRVGRVGDDGYHPLISIFQAVSIFDEIAVTPVRRGLVTCEISGPQASRVPTDGRNLAVKAARHLAAHLEEAPTGVHIAIRKEIPVAGGMAGGSADAAATLLACSTLWQTGLAIHDLAQVGAALGSDVPFPLVGGIAVGTGRGDKLAPVLGRGAYHWVLALSDAELSTPAVYRRFDELGEVNVPLEVPADLMNGLAAGDPRQVAPHLVNDLQAAAVAMQPSLQRVMDAGSRLGALGALVSGSGPTVAFLAADEESAIDLSVALSAEGVCRAVRRASGPVPGARLIA
jgi:4-diphosphocytidyl-2-C-methyl-D-erythritol kinase